MIRPDETTENQVGTLFTRNYRIYCFYVFALKAKACECSALYGHSFNCTCPVWPLEEGAAL